MLLYFSEALSLFHLIDIYLSNNPSSNKQIANVKSVFVISYRWVRWVNPGPMRPDGEKSCEPPGNLGIPGSRLPI